MKEKYYFPFNNLDLKNRNKICLLLINLGLFTVIGSLMSRLHVLQEWMAMNYEQFSLVLFSFSLGAVISNLIIGRFIQMKGAKKVLVVTMFSIVLAMIGFWDKPNYQTLIGLWMLLSFGFSGSMIVLPVSGRYFSGTSWKILDVVFSRYQWNLGYHMNVLWIASKLS